MVHYITFVFIFWCHHMHIDFLVLGQRACSQDSIVLDSCDGRMISNNNINIDFGVIKRQCSCTVEPINNVVYVYTLLKYPRDTDCGTRIQIAQSNNAIDILRCSSDSHGSILTNLSSVVMFRADIPLFIGNDEYCLQIFTIRQRACSQDRNVLDGCDGRIVTNNVIYIDFGVIRRQCFCTVKPINNVLAMYILSQYPQNNNCGTGIQIAQSNNVIDILRCSDSPGIVLTNLSSVVMFIKDNPLLSGYEEYCLRIFTNNASDTITGFCGTSTNTPALARTATYFNISTTKSIASFSTEKATGFLTSDGNVLSLQIPLAIFVVISVILFILTVYLGVKLKLRNKSMNEKEKTTPETDTNNYTELRLENMAAESANQYESLTRP